jgi:hypothetical protein
VTRLRAPLVALAASFVVLLLGATPRAEAGISNATLAEPVDQNIFGTAHIPYGGTFTVDAGTRLVSIGVKRDLPDAPTWTGEVTQFNGSGQFSLQTPDFPFNGKYVFDANFFNEDKRSPLVGGCGNEGCTRSFHRTVYLAAPPAPPSKISTSFDEAQRTVTVTWAEAPEPDILGWTVRRGTDGGEPGDEESVKPTKTPSFIDKKLPDAGGRLEYFVTAVRSGADDTSTRRTTASKTITVEAKPPDAPTTTTPPGGTTTTTSPFGPAVTAPPSTVAPRPTVKGNIGGFAAGLNGPGKGTTRSTLADGTYEETLPYGAPEELEPGGQEAQEVFPTQSPIEAGGTLAAVFYVAAAALTSVVAAHVIFILRQVKKADLADAAAASLLPAIVEPAPPPVRRQPRVAQRIAPGEPPPKRTPRKVR